MALDLNDLSVTCGFAAKEKQARGQCREPGRYPPPKEGSNKNQSLTIGGA
jgi:hypothetical protein